MKKYRMPRKAKKAWRNKCRQLSPETTTNAPKGSKRLTYKELLKITESLKFLTEERTGYLIADQAGCLTIRPENFLPKITTA